MKITLKPYLDVRRADGDKPMNMMVLMTRRGKSAMIPIGLKLAPSLWDRKTLHVRNCPQKIFFDRAIYDRLYQVQEAVTALSEEVNESLLTLGITQIKDIVRDMLDGRDGHKAQRNTFAACFKKFMEGKSGRTREVYLATWKHIGKFTDKAERLRFDDIDVRWLSAFDAYLSETSPSQNARSIHFRNIRAVFNYGINNDVTTLYPFRKFKIRTEQTAKRSLSAADIRKIATMPLLEWQELYRDIFMLGFYLIGINLVDLFALTHENVQNGRIVYKRSKTKKLYSIRIEPEAQAILDRRKGVAHLLDVADRYKNHADFTSRFNRALKTFGTWEVDERHSQRITYHPYWDFLSSYWVRHSWATIAYNDCDVPIDVISQALGHSMGGSKVTMVYINADRKKVDEANRRVIDYVMGV